MEDWRDARSRVVARCEEALAPEVAAALIRDWGLRSLPEVDADRDRAEIEQIATEHANDASAADAIARAGKTADRLERALIDARFSFRIRDPQMLAAQRTAALMQQRLSEDRRLALVRLRRDVATTAQ
jgi:hypothetical protein